jgi:hypothetical protein
MRTPKTDGDHERVRKFVAWVKRTPHSNLTGNSRVASDAQMRVLDQLLSYLEGGDWYLNAHVDLDDDKANAVALGAASPVRLEEQVHTLRQAVMLAILAIDCERNGLTPDGNVRERLVKALNRTEASALPVPATGPQDDGGTSRSCTCHPDDHPPVPCAEKYAYSECVAAAARRSVPATGPSLRALPDVIAKWSNRADRGFNPEESDESYAYWQGVRAVLDDLGRALAAGSAPSVIPKADHEDDHTRVDSQ